jgi:hypothetical protein
MGKTANFRILNPVTATTRMIAEVLNGAMNGKMNCHGDVTLPSGGADVTVTDPRASKESVILLEPHTSNYYHHNPYIKTKNDGSFVIGQANNGQSTDISYVIIG